MLIKNERKTKETAIIIELDIDGSQQVDIKTGIAFLDHMLEQLAVHARWDLKLHCEGDLEIDDHHTVEDIALCLGDTVQQAWRGRKGIKRYGQRLLPMDETLVLCALDICGRANAVINLPFSCEYTGKVHTEMWTHFFKSFASAAAISLHMRCETFENNHHLIEASFKALAYAIDEALSLRDDVVSTKGALK